MRRALIHRAFNAGDRALDCADRGVYVLKRCCPRLVKFVNAIVASLMLVIVIPFIVILMIIGFLTRRWDL